MARLHRVFSLQPTQPHGLVTTSTDAIAAVWCVAVFVLPPFLGWFFMVADYRAYLRGLRRAMVVLGAYATGTPLWALRQRPECLTHLGLEAGCTREEVMAAYRQRVKRVHPDHGGSRRQFERLQQCLAEALVLVEAEP